MIKLSRNRILGVALLGVALAFGAATFAQTPEQQPQPAPSAKCATAAVSLNSKAPKAGDELTATVSVQNCAAEKTRVVLQYSYTDPCGNTTQMGTAPLKVAAGEKQDATITFLAPSAECAGDFTVGATVLAEGKELTSASTTFRVAGK